MESMMGKEQHGVYVEILTGQTQAVLDLSRPTRPLSAFKHQSRKIGRLNYDLTKACKTAYDKVFARHRISQGDAFLTPTTFELAAEQGSV